MYNIKILNCIFVLFFLSTSSLFAFNKKDFDKAINYLKCRNCDLTNANFSKLMIQGIDLEQSNLTGADFSNADLSIAKKEKFVLPSNLTRVNLKNANFSNANLSGVNFEGAYLKNVNFSGANLTDANLKDASLKGANFEEAKLDGTLLSN